MNKLDLYEDADKDMIARLMEPGLHEDDWCSWSPLWCTKEFLTDGLIWLNQHDYHEYSVELTWAGVKVASSLRMNWKPNILIVPYLTVRSKKSYSFMRPDWSVSHERTNCSRKE